MKFPTYPTDILDRADALLSSKYPDGIVDPALVELLCKMAVEERERWMAERDGWQKGVVRQASKIAELTAAKAIRGTE